MKQKWIAVFPAFALSLVLLTVPAFALGAFSDVTDQTTARNVEILQLMGVIDGDNGLFRPNSSLTRAEFCKMAVTMQGRGEQMLRYRSRTIFPDVRPSHWAAGYVNLASVPASDKEQAMMHGFPDGTFHPDDAITYGEAVAVLMRALGYTDADSGGVWPQGYIDLGKAKELTTGVSLSGSSPITRAQAAQLFVNMLTAKTPSDGTLKTLGDETILMSVDVVKGELRTRDGTIEMVNPMPVTVLTGLKGKIVKQDNKALTFLPSASKGGGLIGNGAVIVQADGSPIGLDALTGGVSDTLVYRNGIQCTLSDLKKGDVVTYSSATDALIACDTRVKALFESAVPSPNAAVTMKALGTEFSVLNTAQQSLSLFKPGDQLVLQLTADGQVAGATLGGKADTNGNALAFVTMSGKVKLICGGNLLDLDCTVDGRNGRVGRIEQGEDGIVISDTRGSLTGVFDADARKLGNIGLSENVIIINESGEQIALSELTVKIMPANQIRYAHVDSMGKVDVLLLGEVLDSNEFFGRVEIYFEDDSRMLRLNYGGETVAEGYATFDPNIRSGDYVYMRVGRTGKYIQEIEVLASHIDISESAWLNDYTVNVGGGTCTVPAQVAIYNKNADQWMSTVKEAREYGGKLNMYIRDSVVRFIEVSK